MQKILYIYLIPVLLSSSISCSAQNTIIGGGCDGCELMYIDKPNEINSESYSPAWDSGGEKLQITGKVLNNDGRTPAANVIIYYWQTDDKGHYPQNKYLNKKAKKHGYIRGWVKSDTQGNYSIYTIKPKAYPNRTDPAHIHLSIKEPKLNTEYYVDNLVFNYDPLLTTQKRKKLQNRGGSGILRTLKSEKFLIAEHNIILGLNIPNYPKTKSQTLQSGQQVGDDFHSISPFHAWGPDIGKTTCPVCQYGRHFGIMYFVNEIQSPGVKKWLRFFEEQSKSLQPYLKSYLIYGDDNNYSFELRNKQLSVLGQELQLKELALTFVPSFLDIESDIHLSKINPKAKNTLIIYKNRNIISKFINIDATQENFDKIKQVIKSNQNKYINLPIDKS